MKPARPVTAFFLAAILAACTSSGVTAPPTPGGDRISAETARSLVADLCSMRGTGDEQRANATFYDRIHDLLHVLAKRVQEKDAVAAAHLLEAKNRVEEDLAAVELPEFFADDLGKLTRSVRASLRTLGMEPPSC